MAPLRYIAKILPSGWQHWPEEVPRLLAVEGEHGHQVGGVHAVSEEFQSHARTRIETHRLQRVWLGYVGQSNDAVVGTLEDAGIGVTAPGGGAIQLKNFSLSFGQ